MTDNLENGGPDPRRHTRHPKTPELERSWVGDQGLEGDVISDHTTDEVSVGSSDEYDLLSSQEMPCERSKQYTPKLRSGARKASKPIGAVEIIKSDEHFDPHSDAERSITSSKEHGGSSKAAYVANESQLLMPTLDHTVAYSQHPGEVIMQRSTMRRRKAVDGRRKAEKPRNDRASSTTWRDTFSDFSAEAFDLATDILQMSMRNLKAPISYLVTGLVMYLVCWTAWSKITGKIESTFSTGLCNVPAVPWLIPSFCGGGPSSFANMPAPPAEFDRLMASNKHFEEVLASRAESVALPAVMKRSEASIRDLRTLVTVSTLKSRQELVLEFDNFIETSRIAVRDLTVFNSHVDRSADFILSAARWTRRVLDDIETERITGSHYSGGITASLMGLVGLSAPKTAEQRVLDRYMEHAEAVEEQIHRLVLEAQALDQVLLHLDNRLDAIGEIGAREDSVASTRRHDLLAELWTRLGGNRGRLGRFDAELQILRQVGQQRRTATAQVGDAILRLQEMEAELAGLRERVGATRLLAASGAGGSGIPISLHLENIEKGVQRLEATREDSKKKFDEFQQKAWAGAAQGLEDKKAAIDSN